MTMGTMNTSQIGTDATRHARAASVETVDYRAIGLAALEESSVKWFIKCQSDWANFAQLVTFETVAASVAARTAEANND